MSIKRYLEFIKENQTKLFMEEMETFPLDTKDFKQYLEDLNIKIKVVRNREYWLGYAEFNEENEYDNFNYKNIVPEKEYSIAYRFNIEFDNNEFDNETIDAIRNYIETEYKTLELVYTSEYQVKFLVIYSTVKNKISKDDWLKFYSDWKIINGKIAAKISRSNLADSFKYDSKSIDIYLSTGDYDADDFFSYDELEYTEMIDALDDYNIKLLYNVVSSELKNDDISDAIKDMKQYLIDNKGASDEVIYDLISLYTDYCYSASNETATDRILTSFDTQLEKSYGINILEQERINDSDYFWYEFKWEWVIEMIENDYDYDSNCSLNTILSEWFPNFIEKEQFSIPDIQFSYYLATIQEKSFNLEAKSILEQ